MFACDWSYGRIYAIHMQTTGATYTATTEVFLSGRPLPAVDIQVGPDGALYFLTGGRGVQSAIYRVTHQSNIAPQSPLRTQDADARSIRRKLETLHESDDPASIDIAWPYLKHSDRAIRYAARVAVERYDELKWAARALREHNVQASLEALLALARQGRPDRQARLLAAMARFRWNELTAGQKVTLLRTYQIMFRRMKAPTADARQAMLNQLDEHFPNSNGTLDRELASVLFELSASKLLDRTVTSLDQTSTAMRQIHYLMLLKELDSDSWTEAQKEQLRSVLEVDEIRLIASRPYRDVVELLGELLKTVDATGTPAAVPQPRKLVKEWVTADLLPHVTEENLENRDLQRGCAIFRKARCHTCHRIGSSGGTLGPNLTAVGGRFRPRDVLEAIIEPNKVVADSYRTTLFLMNDGRQIAGQIVDLGRGQYTVRTDPLQPFARVRLNESDIEKTRPSKVSLMPSGLVNHLTRNEILDLMAYLLTSSPNFDSR